MSQITQQSALMSEGTITFKLNPIENGKDRLYLIDVGLAETKNRITLSVVKKDDKRLLSLEIYNKEGEFLETSESFTDFKIGNAFDVELVWSTGHNKVAVFVDNKQFLEMGNDKISFDGLGKTVYFGEDITGENKTQINVE